jgi:4-amino-4-deoxy-L-arabinose transferase-like glycosyltransferase
MNKLSSISPVSKFLLVLIVGVFILRSFTLEMTDLIDPTESRYASVAAHMVTSGDWVVPMLNLPAGVEPYLGKPPLHFWLTAISYKLFGQEEWTSRLPSLIAAMFIVGAVVRFGRAAWNLETGLLAGLVTISTPFLFMFSGGSVTDVTLTACISWGVVSAYLLLATSNLKDKKLNGYLLAVSVALGFLTKGPVAIALTGLPIILFLIFKRDIAKLREIPWLSSALIFLAITSPWFILSELRNPGFLKYFFWNENIARYLIKDYGDKYGSGHVYPRGMAVLMMILVTLPWSIILVAKYFKDGWGKFKRAILAHDGYHFTLIWGASSAIFFCLVRQLHAAYLIPAVPGIALSVAANFSAVNLSLIKQRLIFIGTALVGLLLIGISGSASSYTPAIIESLVFLLIALTCLWFFKFKFESLIANLSTSLVVLCLLSLIAFTPYLNSHRSAEGILKNIARVTNAKNLKIGITASNLYSPYWLSMSTGPEFPEAIKISYVNPAKAVEPQLKHVLVRRDDLSAFTMSIHARFKLVCSFGKWNWLTSRKKLLKRPAAEICPFDLPL